MAQKRIRIPHNFDPSQRPYQLECLASNARFKFYKIHRKAGKTALLVNEQVADTFKEKGIHWYVGPTYRQAKEIVWRDPEMLKKFYPPELIEKKNESELTIENIIGSVLGIKGADDPDSLRGPNPKTVTLDEVYLMKKEIVTEIILPIAFANPTMKLTLAGTPKATGKYWEDLFQEWKRRMEAGDPNYFVMELKASESGILSPEMLADAQATMTQEAFEQEFEVKYFGDGGVVFRGVDNIVEGPYKEPPYDGRFTYKFGIDLAMHVDWTVCCGINRQTHRLEIFDRYNQIDYNLQKARIEAMLRRYGMADANVDQTGVGAPIVQDLQDRGLNVNGITFTESMKRNLVTNLAIWIEQRKIKIPAIPELIDELKIFGYEVLPSGRIRYGAPEGYHDDCVMALALAVWQLGSKMPPHTLEPKGKSTSSRLSFS